MRNLPKGGHVPIRLAGTDDLPALRALEVEAGRLFTTVGMDQVAGDEAQPVEEYARRQRAGHIWVTDEGAGPVGYLMVDLVDGNVHVEQVSVAPGSARRGLGRMLIEHVAGWAVTGGFPALTLTTFRDVAWNAPYYRRLGFRDLPPAEETPGLRAIRAHEGSLGLDGWPRLCMRRNLNLT
jgi:GNAT superfamily N-acetyltransferase